MRPHALRHAGGAAERSMSDDARPDALEAALEASRRNSGLRVDREGRFWHQGTLIAHPRIQAVLAAGVARHATTGEYIVCIGQEWAYLEVDDAPLVVLGLDDVDGTAYLRLSDGHRERLDPARLWLGAADVPYASTRGDSMPARFSRTAFQVLARWLELGEDGVVRLHLEGTCHVLRREVPCP